MSRVANTLDKLELGLSLQEAAGHRKISVDIRLLRWLVNRVRRTAAVPP